MTDKPIDLDTLAALQQAQRSKNFELMKTLKEECNAEISADAYIAWRLEFIVEWRYGAAEGDERTEERLLFEWQFEERVEAHIRATAIKVRDQVAKAQEMERMAKLAEGIQGLDLSKLRAQ